MKEKVVVDYFDTVSGFRFRDEYGRQLQQDDFIARNGIGHFRVYDGKKELSKDDVEQLISERTGIAYKTGLMMPIDEFEKDFVISWHLRVPSFFVAMAPRCRAMK